MKTRASLFLTAILTAGTGACGNRLLVGNDSDGGSPPAQTGAAGTGSVPTAGASGTGGLTGVAGTGSVPTTGASGTGGLTGMGGTGFPTTGVAGTGGLTTGVAGTGGGSTTTRIVTPLRISGEDAVTRIASVLWNEAPSADLLSQAKLGHFTATDDLYGAIRQMLADPRARVGLGAFYRWWLDLDRLDTLAKDPQAFPAFTKALAADMAAETETFGVEVTLMPGGTFRTLMMDPFSYLNQRLAALYGVAGVTGDALRRTDLDPKQRAGLVTQPSLQALSSFETRNSPSRRGVKLLNAFECMLVPESPPNIPGLGPVTTTTVRQALAASISQSPVCTACHGQIDPPGLALETFDAIGRWRTTDNGFPVDASASLLNLTADGSPALVDGPIGLAGNLARSPRTQECMARQWLSFVTGTRVNELDDRVVQDVNGVFQAAGLDLKELIVAVLTSEPFLAP